MEYPRISIVTAVRNGEHHLEKAIQSVLTQGYPNLEYIIFDGASTDGTVDLIKRYAPRLALWKSEKDGGPNAAYDAAMRHTTGEIVGFLNADDWYEPGILQAVADAFKADPQLEVVACKSKVLCADAGGTLQEISAFAGPKLGIFPRAYPSPNIRFYKRSVFEKCGGLHSVDENGRPLVIHGDVAFLLSMALQKVRWHALDMFGYTHLAHAGSMTFSGNPGDINARRRVREEKRSIGERFMAIKGPLPKGMRFWLKRIHARASAYLFYYAIMQKRWSDVGPITKRAMRWSPLLWPGEVIRLFFSGRYKKP